MSVTGPPAVEALGTLLTNPWIYAVIAASILLDVFLPVLPSGLLVVTTAAAAAAGGAAGQAAHPAQHVPDLCLLVVCAAGASVLGDLAAFRLARRGGARLDRAISRSRRLTRAQETLGTALARGGGALVVIARFAPAGRSVVSLGAGKTHRTVRQFLPWSALAGITWAVYGVVLGYFGTRWLGAAWLGTAVSVVALFLAGSLAVYVVRRTPPPRPVAAP
ncbi:DedA family protein [Streptomyces sp. BI20]|uniref:DedA family protein n=1 Tax=Streptomyces sp. BI20 TaxID=3403460 RepID=UPI003C72EE89